jgi:hypothetical protein
LEKRIFGKEDLETRRVAFSKASTTFKEPTLVSLLRLQKYPKTDTSHMEKLRDYKPHNKGKERVRITVFGEVATSTADITTFKILINITLSTKDAEMMMMDIHNY